MGSFGLLLLLILSLLGTALGNFATSPADNNAEICLLPKCKGPCRARIARYYYDRHLQSCQRFWYGGCQGNANNFKTQNDCKKTCWRIQEVPPNCLLEVSEKPCKNATKQYYFNLKSMTCEQVKSGNCLGNENSFPDKAACMRLCVSRRNSSFCYSPKDERLCSANVTCYYANSRHKACEPITYPGCGENGNNFVSVEDCKRVCKRALKKERKSQRVISVNRNLRTQKIQL
ncbi:tissue factor pathway inhibitor 2 [Echinops telfairi]|uniref:Tissue factor pathway inhibitor n=1 Tax=Echinops telfairi TaxID=9371 RepID=A0ABM0ILL1_ECHTE|nr:tissue factor pathway inhibitor 2 [Echinops telfairi]